MLRPLGETPRSLQTDDLNTLDANSFCAGGHQLAIKGATSSPCWQIEPKQPQLCRHRHCRVVERWSLMCLPSSTRRCKDDGYEGVMMKIPARPLIRDATAIIWVRRDRSSTWLGTTAPMVTGSAADTTCHQRRPPIAPRGWSYSVIVPRLPVRLHEPSMRTRVQEAIRVCPYPAARGLSPPATTRWLSDEQLARNQPGQHRPASTRAAHRHCCVPVDDLVQRHWG